MAIIVTRSGKGSPLTNNEVDANFTNLNTDKLESGDTAASLTITTADINGGTIDGVTIGGSSAGAITGTTGQFNTSLNVDGAVTADELTIDGDTISFNTSAGSLDINPLGGASVELQSSAALGVVVSGIAGFTVKNDSDVSIFGAAVNGDISFYDDSSNVKLFWNASVDRLGIGTDSPATTLDVNGAATLTGNTSPASDEVLLNLASQNGTGTAGNMLRFTDKDPTATNNGAIGKIQFYSEDTDAVVVEIEGQNADASPDGRMLLKTAEGTTLRNRIQINNTGDISFYEDTGTTAKFFWDASAEALGIGTSSPNAVLTSLNSGALTLDSNDGDHSGFGLLVTPSARTANTVNSAIGFASSTGRKFAAIGLQAYADTDQNGLNFYVQETASGTVAQLSEAMRITNTGNVGIGTSSPSYPLHVVAGTDGFIMAEGSTTAAYYLRESGEGIAAGGLWRTILTGGKLVFSKNSAAGGDFTSRVDAVTIDSSGNFLVGKTATGAATEGVEAKSDGKLNVTRDDNVVAFFRRNTSDGTILEFAKDGTTVGSIASTFGIDIHLGTGDTRLRFVDQNDYIRPANSDGSSRDGLTSLGDSSARFDDIYATNGTIQTSDANEKQDIEALSEAEHRVAVAAKGLLRKFRWISSVEEKGDEARIHFGIIAQDLQAAFEAEGLDAGRYAMFIHSTWTDEETGEERSRMGVRYSELLAFIIAAL